VVGNLLDYARPVAGAPQQVDIRRVFRHTSVLTTGLAETHEVTVSASGDARQSIYASPDQIIQCLVNLVANAIQACEPGGVVQLRAFRHGDRITMDINDNGCGMHESVLQRVTEPFFTTRQEGTGLGLSITRQLIELNEGDLLIQSTEGEGTTVSVTLPAANSDNLLLQQKTQKQRPTDNQHALTDSDR